MDSTEPDQPEEPSEAAGTPRQPAWARQLRALYDAVVDEELPDSFRALLDRLDESPD